MEFIIEARQISNQNEIHVVARAEPEAISR
jgi:hypothetical protein